MESKSSSRTTNPTFLAVDNDKIGGSTTSVGGRKANGSDKKNQYDVAELVELSSNSTEVSSDDEELMEMEDVDVEDVMEDDSEEEDEDEDDDEDEEFEEFMKERKWILEDAKNLQALADFFAHPEKPVVVDGFACARNFFSRPSADEFVEEEEEDERDAALADAMKLKKLAVDFQHPELALKVDATACARNYFSQPWATEQETFGAAEERVLAVQQAQQMAQTAHVYQHPEVPVKGWENPAVMGRNFFERPSAEDAEEEAERALILQEMKSMKQWASIYQHPEAPLEVDAATFGRNYFNRASAPEQEEDEYTDDREIVLEEMKELKELAHRYQHPEAPLEVDAAAFGRNYFNRASAPETEEDEYGDDREIVLEEMKELKQLAYLYQHPEAPLEVDATACARNYFTRPSAPEQEEDEYGDDREIILEEMKELTDLAVMYRHPELPVEVDATACARNYFTRPSAPEQEEDEYGDDREIILEEMKELKEAAVLYRHPEMPLDVHAAMWGRNYFDRASAEEEDDVDEEERAAIMEDLKALKSLAMDYRHPERPVKVDALACARNYFSRPSAPLQEDDDVDEERQEILEDMALMKQQAAAFLHPERPLSVDPTCFGRNYYSRFSAEDKDTFGAAEERARIIAEAALLKKQATVYMHPEIPLETDPAVVGRNYFTRPSAEDFDSEEEEERALVLQDMAKMKKLAVDFLHPERPVVNEDPCAFGRNYFERSFISDMEEAPTERELVMADAVALYKLAVDFNHPEMPVKTTDATVFARNYFSRASAPQQESAEEAMERAQILADAAVLKKLSKDYFHPEVPVVTADSAACGRNYFARASAHGAADHIRTEGFANPSEEQRYVEPEEHSHYDDYGHFDMDEDIYYDMRQSIVLPMTGPTSAKVQTSKFSSDEEGELSRSPSSVMLFTGALGEDDTHPPLPSMG